MLEKEGIVLVALAHDAVLEGRMPEFPEHRGENIAQVSFVKRKRTHNQAPKARVPSSQP
jgi:hypothetical protein